PRATPATAKSAGAPPATVPAISRPGRSDTPGGIGYRPLRCSTSGRLMPDAGTRIRNSPAAGTGSGRCVSRSTSGPPGAVISIARISDRAPRSLALGGRVAVVGLLRRGRFGLATRLARLTVLARLTLAARAPVAAITATT